MSKVKAGRAIRVGLAVAALALLLASPAVADTLTPGTSGSPDSLAPGGTELAGTGVVSWSSATLTGTAVTLVFSDPSNTFCAGCLDFIFAVSNENTSTGDSIERITDTSFQGFQTDVGVATDFSCTGLGPNIAPGTVDRSLNGSVVGFNFGVSNPLAPGDCTSALVIETDATSFSTGTLNVIDGSVASVTTFAPVASTPEPSSIALVLIGLAGFAGLRRRSLTA